MGPSLAGSASLERLRGLVGSALLAGAGSLVVLVLVTKANGASAKVVGAAVMAILAVCAFRTKRTDRALAVSIAYMGLLDGVLRLEAGSSTLTIARDIVLYAVAIGALLRAAPTHERWSWPPVTAWVLGWTAFVVVQVFNPSSGPVLHRIISLRQDLEFIPLFFLGYTVVRSRRHLRALALLILAIGALNGIVGAYQSSLSPDQLATWGPGYSAMIKGTSGAAPTTAVGADGKPIVRPPGLGGDMGYGGAVGMIALPCGLALLLRRGRRKRERAAIALMTICTTLGVITSESRASILSAVVGLIAFAAILAASREGKRVLIGLVTIGVTVGIAMSFVSSNSLARYDTISPSKLAGTVSTSRSSTTALIPTYAGQFPFGAGIGSSGPAWHQYGASANTIDGESQLTFLIGEVGIPGLILFLGFQAKMLVGSARRVKRIRDSESRLLIAGLIAPLFAFVANWYVGINTVSPPNAPYMWGAFGVLAFWLLRRGGVFQPDRVGA